MQIHTNTTSKILKGGIYHQCNQDMYEDDVKQQNKHRLNDG